MKHFFTLLAAFGFLFANGQNLLLQEDFDYASGSEIRNHGWTPHSNGTTNPIKVHNLGLSLSQTPYLAGGVGLSALINNTGSDENKPFSSSVDTGKVYAAFLLKPNGVISTLGSGFFFHFATYSNVTNPDYTSISTSFRARTYITSGSTSAKFRLGLTFNSATVPTAVGTDVTSDLDTGETYLVVVKYAFVPGADNDLVSLFVFADGDNISQEPVTATLGPLPGTAGDAVALQGIALRQYSEEQKVIFDGLLVRNNWDFATPLAASISVQTQGGATGISSDGGTLQMLATISPNNAAQGVNWSVNDTTLAGISAQGLVTARNNGVVWVRGSTTDGSNLTDSVSLTISNQIGLNDHALKQLEAYPNPSTGRLFLKNLPANAQLRLTTMGGLPVEVRMSGAFELDLKPVPPGLYVLEITTKNSHKALRIVRQTE